MVKLERVVCYTALGEVEVAVGSGHSMTGYDGVVLDDDFGKEAYNLVYLAS